MAWQGKRRFSNTRSRFGGSRGFAKKKLLWTNATFSTDISAGAARAQVLTSAQWVLNATTGNLEAAKVLKIILVNMAVSASGTGVLAGGVPYAMYVDDADASTPGDPGTTTFYDAVQPFHLGTIAFPAFVGGVPTPGTFVNSNFRDNIRSFKVNRKIRTDQALTLHFGSGAAFVTSSTLVVSGLARCLMSLD